MLNLIDLQLGPARVQRAAEVVSAITPRDYEAGVRSEMELAVYKAIKAGGVRTEAEICRRTGFPEVAVRTAMNGLTSRRAVRAERDALGGTVIRAVR